MILNFIQDIATPHNNVLLKALDQCEGVNLNIWYCHDKHSQYSWKNDLTNEVKRAHIYLADRPDWQFIWRCIRNKHEKIFLIGWMNPSTKVLLALFFILRRPFNYWTDYPQDHWHRNALRRYLRELIYFMLKGSRAKIFCVGNMTINYFIRRGFDKSRLVNLPIYVDLSMNKNDYCEKRDAIFSKYGINKTDLFLSAGSRLIYEKGYDLLITAISNLSPKIRGSVKCVIVGIGEERDNLQALIKEYNLEKIIFIEEWMEIEAFKALIANSNVFVQPARFDTYGGGTLYAFSVGTPVIGTYQAGSANERIENATNGFLYDCEDLGRLTELIEYCYDHKYSLGELGVKARAEAEKWAPEIGAEIIIANAI